MPSTAERPTAERSRVPAIVLWTTFSALLLFGLFLYFRYSEGIFPFLDVVVER